jgi:hypothetical protein
MTVRALVQRVLGSGAPERVTVRMLSRYVRPGGPCYTTGETLTLEREEAARLVHGNRAVCVGNDEGRVLPRPRRPTIEVDAASVEIMRTVRREGAWFPLRDDDAVSLWRR